MPLVTNKDAIDIQFQAQTDQFVAESNRVIAKVEEVKRQVKQSGDELIRQAKEEEAARRKATMSWTDFRSMYQTVLDVVRVGQAVWEETGQKFVDNAVTVGNLARAMGTTTEEASRLKEIADDVGISTDSLKTSMKLALKDGFEPNIEGLARMSDEYLKLAPGTERMQYLLDRFGKSGEEMGKILEKGGDSIRSMSAAMDDGLIVTEEAYKQAREYQVAVDSLNDSWDAFTYRVAPGMVRAATNIIDKERDLFRARELAVEQGKTWMFLTGQQIDELTRQAAAERESADAAVLAKDAAEGAGGAFEDEAEKTKRLADEAKLAEQAIKDMTKANENYLDLVGNLSKSNEKYIDDQKEIKKQLDEGKITLEEAQQKWRDLADEQEEASRRMILNMLQQQLSVDGLTTAESTYLLDLGLKWGVYSQQAVLEAKRAQAEVRTLTDAFNGLPSAKDIRINISTSGATQMLASGMPSTVVNSLKKRAGGGSVMAGTPYLVGERGPEVVVPGQSGSVVPNSQMGFDYKQMGKEFLKALRQSQAGL